MPESYFLESFNGGLTAAVKPIVKAFKPATISEAIENMLDSKKKPFKP